MTLPLGWIAVALLSLGERGESRSETISEFAAFPAGAVVLGKAKHPGREMEDSLSLLRESGYFGLASGIEDLFYHDRTEDEPRLHSFENIFGGALHVSPSPLVAGYVACIEDWGRGPRPESTKRALAAIERGEFAVYPGGKSLQLLRGDAEIWRAVMQELGTVRKVATVGKSEIFEADGGKRGRYFSVLGTGVVLRGSDLALITRAAGMGRGASKEDSMRSSPMVREFLAGLEEKDSIRIVCAVDAAALLADLLESDAIPESAVPWLRTAFRGVRGFRFVLEPYLARAQMFADPQAPVRALFAGGTLPSSFAPRATEKSLARVGIHLDVAKLLEAIAVPEKGAEDEGGWMSPQPLAAMLSNLDLKKSRLWVDDSDRAALCVPAADRARLDAAWKLLQGFGPFLPGVRRGVDAGEGADVVAWRRSAESEEDWFALARCEGWIFVASDSSSALDLLSRLRADKNFLDGSRQAAQLVRVQGRDLVADLSAITGAWTGDALGQVLLDSGNNPLTWLRIELGLRPDTGKRVAQLWEALRANRPAWLAKFEANWLSSLEAPQAVGNFSLRWTKGRETAVAIGPERIRVETLFDFIRPLLRSGSRDKESLASFQATIESGLRQASEPTASGASSNSFEAQMDIEPFYDEVMKNPALFRGFLRVAQGSWNWAWFTLRAKQGIRAIPQEKGVQLRGETNREPSLGWMLSAFLDRYRPSRSEERAMARAAAVSEAERLFQVSRSQDLNGNGAGEFGSWSELLNSGAIASTLPAGRVSETAADWVEDGYRYRLLQPKDLDEQEKRWCLFVFPETVDPEHRMVFYIDERGFLLAGWGLMNEQMEAAPSLDFQSLAVGLSRPPRFRELCLASQQPPEHREIYDFFLPYLPFYGGKLQPRD